MMFDIPDHPVIRNCELTGWPDGRDPEYPVCPVCGEKTDTFYKNKETGEIVGCDNCIDPVDAWEEARRKDDV